MRKLYFIIENEELFLEKELVSLEFPLLFLCSSHLCLCTDFDNLEYIVGKISEENIEKMLNASITIRETFKRCEKLWKVRMGEEIAEDIIERIEYSSLKDEELPSINSYLESFN